MGSSRASSTLGLEEAVMSETQLVKKRNPPWEYDEIILALALYFEHRPSTPDSNSAEISELSGTLRALASRLGNELTVDYRNTNGVHMKLMNFKALDPDYEGKGLTSASSKDREVFEAYGGDLTGLMDAAKAIREGITSREPLPITDEPDDLDYEAVEGKLLVRTHRSRERSAAITKRKKQAVMKSTGKLSCEACGFDFRDVYGERGEGFIECHHTIPVSHLRPGQRTNLRDLALLCANCHRMVHRGKRWLSLDELRALLP
jgi:5-methylcytosine-specific restriction protein A